VGSLRLLRFAHRDGERPPAIPLPRECRIVPSNCFTTRELEGSIYAWWCEGHQAEAAAQLALASGVHLRAPMEAAPCLRGRPRRGRVGYLRQRSGGSWRLTSHRGASRDGRRVPRRALARPLSACFRFRVWLSHKSRTLEISTPRSRTCDRRPRRYAESPSAALCHGLGRWRKQQRTAVVADLCDSQA
jgi:hypothetical protein